MEFLEEDFEANYHRAEWKKTPGKNPEAFFYTKSGRLLDRTGLGDFTRDELNSLMKNKGVITKEEAKLLEPEVDRRSQIPNPKNLSAKLPIKLRINMEREKETQSKEKVIEEAKATDEQAILVSLESEPNNIKKNEKNAEKEEPFKQDVLTKPNDGKFSKSPVHDEF